MALVFVILLAVVFGAVRIYNRGAQLQSYEALRLQNTSRAELLHNGCVVESASDIETFWNEPELLDMVNTLLASEPLLQGVRFSPYYLNKTPVVNLLLAMRGEILNEIGSVQDVRVWPVYADEFNLDGPVELTEEQELALAGILQDELRRNGIALQLAWRKVSKIEMETRLRRYPSAVVCEWRGITAEPGIPLASAVPDPFDLPQTVKESQQRKKLMLHGYFDQFCAEGRKRGILARSYHKCI